MQSFIENNEKKIFYFACAAVFIYGLMFPAIPNAMVIIVWSLLSLALLFINKAAYNDWGLRIMFITAFAIGMIDWHGSVPLTLKYILIWPMSYIVGKLLVGKNKDAADMRLAIASGALTIGLFLQGVINYCNHNDGIEISESWNGWNEIWTGNFMSRTVYTFDFILVASALFLSVVLFKKNKKLAIGIIILNIATLVMDMFMARGRLQLCMQVLVTFIMILAILIKNRKTIPNKYKKWFRNVVIAGVVLFILFTIAVALNIAGSGDIYHNSFLGRDGGILRNVRFKSMQEGLILTFQNPLGGWSTTCLADGIAHNVFLLFAREYDIIIFLLLIAFELMALIKGILIQRYENVSCADYFVFAMLLANVLYFNIETCPWRYRGYWVPLILIAGMISQKLSLKKKED